MNKERFKSKFVNEEQDVKILTDEDKEYLTKMLSKDYSEDSIDYQIKTIERMLKTYIWVKWDKGHYVISSAEECQKVHGRKRMLRYLSNNDWGHGLTKGKSLGDFKIYSPDTHLEGVEGYNEKLKENIMDNIQVGKVYKVGTIFVKVLDIIKDKALVTPLHKEDILSGKFKKEELVLLSDLHEEPFYNESICKKNIRNKAVNEGFKILTKTEQEIEKILNQNGFKTSEVHKDPGKEVKLWYVNKDVKLDGLQHELGTMVKGKDFKEILKQVKAKFNTVNESSLVDNQQIVNQIRNILRKYGYEIDELVPHGLNKGLWYCLDNQHAIHGDADTTYVQGKDYMEILKKVKAKFGESINEAEGIYDPRTILKAYNIEKAWIEKMEHTVGGVTQVLLFIINDYKQILDTHAVNKKDVYTYEPKENEYYLDRTRDTGDVITDYNLEPAQKLVDRWNESKKWSDMMKEELEPVYHYSVEDIDQRGDDFDNAEEAYEQAKEQLNKLGYEVKELNDNGEFEVLGTSTGVAYTGVIYPSNPEMDEDIHTLTDKVDSVTSDIQHLIKLMDKAELKEHYNEDVFEAVLEYATEQGKQVVELEDADAEIIAKYVSEKIGLNVHPEEIIELLDMERSDIEDLEESKILTEVKIHYEILDVFNSKEKIRQYLMKTFNPIENYTPEDMREYILSAGNDLDILTGETNSYEVNHLDKKENVEKLEQELGDFVKEYMTIEESLNEWLKADWHVVLKDGKEEVFDDQNQAEKYFNKNFHADNVKEYYMQSLDDNGDVIFKRDLYAEKIAESTDVLSILDKAEK